MSGPKFTGQISVGNLIQIAILVFGLGVGWTTLQAADREHAQSITLNASQIKEIEQARQRALERLRALEQDNARDDERISLILQILARIEAQLEESRR